MIPRAPPAAWGTVRLIGRGREFFTSRSLSSGSYAADFFNRVSEREELDGLRESIVSMAKNTTWAAIGLCRENSERLCDTYSIRIVADSASNVLEETADIAYEQWADCRRGAVDVFLVRRGL